MDAAVSNSGLEPREKAPLSERINLRIIVFAAVMLFLVGYPVYIFVRQAITHGITNHGDYKEVDLKAMGFFQMNPDTATLEDVPAIYRALDGQKVQLRGELYAPNEFGPTVHAFELVYSIQVCCNGGPPLVQERVFAEVPQAKGLPRPSGTQVQVLGTLHVTMHREAGRVVKVYELDVESLEPLQS